MALSSAPSGGIAAPGASSEKLTRSMSLTNLIFLGVSAQIGSGWLFAVLSAAGPQDRPQSCPGYSQLYFSVSSRCPGWNWAPCSPARADRSGTRVCRTA